MPHVIVKLYSGKTQQQKQALADAVAQAVVDAVKCQDEAVSVAIEDVPPERWVEDVYKPDILGSQAIYKRPGYDPLR